MRRTHPSGFHVTRQAKSGRLIVLGQELSHRGIDVLLVRFVARGALQSASSVELYGIAWGWIPNLRSRCRGECKGMIVPESPGTGQI